MINHTTNKYHINIFDDEAFKEDSVDNVNHYDFVYFEESKYRSTSIYGIKVFKNGTLIKSAAIGAIGGGTSIHETSTIIEDDRLLICCSDTIFCLSIPDLALLWRTQADGATCFEIYKYQDTYIIHGELEISRLDRDGKILWQQGGADIFVTTADEQSFELTKHFIMAKDFENRVYKFDYDGNNLSTKPGIDTSMNKYKQLFESKKDEVNELGITFNAPCSGEDLTELELKLSYPLPPDLIEFYTFCNGFNTDDWLFRVIPVHEAVDYKSELANNIFHFAEYMINSDQWLIQLQEGGQYEVINDDHGSQEMTVQTTSILKFLDIYLTEGLFSKLDNNSFWDRLNKNRD
ncbi:SMI1/KNR4 family protein [Pedobacter sp. R-06]|uniref:SMI1/KNR4 family protein n=1 Tax=Pedobacter sp. R-06 TaxID=3404051 RepID=UPI003CEA9B2D